MSTAAGARAAAVTESIEHRDKEEECGLDFSVFVGFQKRYLSVFIAVIPMLGLYTHPDSKK